MADFVGGTTISGSSQQLITGPCIYRGFSLKEISTTATASLVLYDSLSAGGTILDVITLAPGESAREFYTPGTQARIGVYVSVVSGAVAGSIRSS